MGRRPGKPCWDALSLGCGAMAVRDEGDHENAVDVRGITAADVSTKLSRPLGETGRTRRKAIPIAGVSSYHGGERPMETFSEVKSLGPCSEEAEAALTDEVMLSLWYGGLNRIYVQKFRGEGRWAFCSDSTTPSVPATYCRLMFTASGCLDVRLCPVHCMRGGTPMPPGSSRQCGRRGKRCSLACTNNGLGQGGDET